jgi:hypothetical protein
MDEREPRDLWTSPYDRQWATARVHTARVDAYERIARLVGVEARSDCYVQGEADAVVQAVERATSDDWTHRAADGYARVCSALGVVRADGSPGDVDAVLQRIAALQQGCPDHAQPLSWCRSCQGEKP